MHFSQLLLHFLQFLLGLDLGVGYVLDLGEDLQQVIEADRVTEVYEGQHVALDALDVLVD